MPTVDSQTIAGVWWSSRS